MQPKRIDLDAATVTLTLNAVERATLVEHVVGLPRRLAETLRQVSIKRDRIQVGPNDLEFLDAWLSLPRGRSVKKEARRVLQGIHDQIAEELNLLNSRTSSVAVDNASHTLYKASLRSRTSATINDAHQILIKLRALPLRLRGFKLTAKDKRLLRGIRLPVETLARINAEKPSLNLADVLLIFAKRYEFDRITQAAVLTNIMELRSRILDFLDQESRRTIEINRSRSLKWQQTVRRTSSN